MKYMTAFMAAAGVLALWAGGSLAVTWYIPKAVAVVGITVAGVWSAAEGVRSSPDRNGLLFALFCLSLNLFLAGHLASGLPPGTLWVWVSYAGGVLAGPLFLHLAARFPVPRPDLRWLVVAGYALAALVAASEVSGLLGAEWLSMMPGLAFLSAGLLGGAGVLWSSMRRASAARSRLSARRAEMLLLGILACIVPLAVFLPGLLPAGAGQVMSLSLLFVMLLPLAGAVALARPDLYDPTSLVRQTMVWAGVAAVALLSYLLLLPLLTWLNQVLTLDSSRDAAIFLAAFAVALMVRPTQLWLERLVDRLFFPERRGFQELLEGTSRALATTITPADLQRLIAEELPARIGAGSGLLLVLDSAEQNLMPLAGIAPLIPPVHPLWALAEELRGPSAFRGLVEGVPSPSLLLPLRVADRLVGAYFLGTRGSGEMYTADEVRRLTVLSHYLAVAVENVRGAMKLEQLNRRALAEIEERNHIAREIHDTLAQGLTGIALQFEIAQMFRETNPAKVDKALARGLELARENLNQARRSVLELRASLLGDQSLPEALSDLADRAAADLGSAEGEFRLIGAYVPLPTRVETALYRIAQEAVHNAVKYSQAEHLAVTLCIDPDEACLSVRDDGVGFDPDALPGSGSERGGFGLTGIRERVRLVGGRMEVESAPGAGTCISINVPLNSTEGESA